MTQKKGQILIVDDNPDNIRVIVEMLGTAHYGICFANTGEEALGIAGSNPLDLILLDIVMPGMGGLEVCQRLKSDPGTKAIPVIFLSALAQTEDIVRGFALGAVDYVTKPVEKEILLARVDTHLTIRRLQTDLEEKVAERTRELKFALDLIDNIIQCMPSILVCIDDGGNILLWNDRAGDYTGLSPKAAQQRSLTSIFPELIPVLGRLKNGLLTQPFSSETCTVRDKGGRERYFDITMYPLNSGMKSAVIRMDDITDQVQMKNLLAQSQKMESIGRLAGGIAHDFNNILAAIMGYAELSIMKLPQGHAVGDNLDKILKAGMRARDLIQQILTFSRQAQKELYPLPIKEEVKEALRLVKASLPASIEIQERIEATAMVLADPVQVHQIMMNLCTNAGHAMQSKGGVLSVSLTDLPRGAAVGRGRHPDLGGMPLVHLRVRDSGCGITPEVLPLIFDPFFTTKAPGEGTGMGLAVVHGIVEALKGAIDVQSGPHEGTCVDIFLPVVDAEAVPLPSKEHPPARGSEKILFIDDESPLVEIGKSCLESLGYQVETQTDPRAALDLFKASPGRFDLVITDMSMPGMTGAALAREMLSLRPDLPVLICTGFSAQMTEKDAGDMGIKGFLMKPLTLAELATMVRRILDD